MAYKAANQASATLAVGLNNTTDTTLQVAAGKGDLFPVIAGSDHTYITLEKSGAIETVKVTARASGSDSMTVVRAQDGTTIHTWLVGDIVECRPCAAAIADLQGEMSALDTALMAAHTGAADPHPAYTTADELAAYAQPLDDELSALALMDPARVAELTALSAFIGSLLNDADQKTALVTLGALLNGSVAKTATYKVVAANRGQVIDCSGGSWTLDVDAVATLGAGFAFGVKNSDTGVITVDPNLSESIDNAASLDIGPGESCLIQVDESVTGLRSFGRTVALPAATASVNGYMTSTYAAKLDGIAAGATVGVSKDVGFSGIGAINFMFSSMSIPSGATVSGGSIEYPGNGAAVTSSGVSASGTWRNIGASINNGWSTFQRIA